MVSKLIIVRSRSSSLRITSQRNDELNRRKDPKSAPSNRERIFNKIEDRKDGLSQSLQEAVKMTETLTSIFHRERGNQQEGIGKWSNAAKPLDAWKRNSLAAK
jgi:hypothetical protein